MEIIGLYWKIDGFPIFFIEQIGKTVVFHGFPPGQAQTRPGPGLVQAQAWPKTLQNIGKLEKQNKNWKLLDYIGKLQVFQYFLSKILEKLLFFITFSSNTMF